MDIVLPKQVHLGDTLDVLDRRADLAKASRITPISNQFKAAFAQSKAHIVRTHPSLTLADRHDHARALAKRMRSVPADAIHAPAPGGVGYGTFYDSVFNGDFISGTEIVWGAVCPATPGGNVNSFLYITATNRSAMGVEALVSYNGGGTNQCSFIVYDWSLPEASRWQASIDFAGLNPYLKAETYAGTQYPVLPIWNSTTKIADGKWQNSVYLFDGQQGKWALAYQNSYAATDDAQRGQWVGSWGPIVETFQGYFSGTNPMGALGVQLRSSDATGAWAAWTELGPNQATLRQDNVGFADQALDPYYDWIVTS